MKSKTVINTVNVWIQTMVVGLDLCPFANRELLANRVRFSVTKAVTEEALLTELQIELDLLSSDSTIETTLLIHPEVLQDFHDYNQFLDYADQLLQEMQLEGVYQIASFHPEYQFADTEPGDAENYTNRSPYPMLHLIREASLTKAIASYPDADEIPKRNIAITNKLGRDKLHALMKACHEPHTSD